MPADHYSLLRSDCFDSLQVLRRFLLLLPKEAAVAGVCAES